jgi:hypothetical protein
LSAVRLTFLADEIFSVFVLGLCAFAIVAWKTYVSPPLSLEDRGRLALFKQKAKHERATAAELTLYTQGQLALSRQKAEQELAMLKEKNVLELALRQQELSEMETKHSIEMAVREQELAELEAKRGYDLATRKQDLPETKPGSLLEAN